MTILIGTKDVAGRRSCIVGKCAECHEKTYVRPWWASTIEGGAMLVCLECATQAFVGEVEASARPVPGHQVYVDWHVLRHHEIGLAVDLATHEPGHGFSYYDLEKCERVDPDKLQSSPRWIKCPRCAVARGDPCRGVSYCYQRLEDNRIRLETLDSWAVEWETPCHKTGVWLCWRSAGDALHWSGVPCFASGCEKTYQIELHASELTERRVPIERLNPQRVEMACWATEESDPWGT